MPDRQMLSWSTALVSYAEPLIEGRRIAVIGDAERSMGAELVRRGAESVHVYDPDSRRAKRVKSDHDAVHIGSLREAELALRNGAFDLAIVEDAGAVADLGALLQLLAKAISSKGAALICASNPDARERLLPEATSEATILDYYTLYDVAAAAFPVVRMFGQAPFVGYAIVDFAPDAEVEPSLDTSLLDDERGQPERFIALASNSAFEVDAFSLIEVPFEDVAAQWPAQEKTRRRRRSSADEDRARIQELEAENRRLRKEQQRPALTSQLAELRVELDAKEAWIGELESRAETADARADATLEELEEAQARISELEKRPERPLATETVARRSEAEVRLEAELTRLRSELQQARPRFELELSTVAAELEKARADLKSARAVESDSDSAAEIEQLEALLRTQGHTLRQLEQELASKVRVGRELLAELEDTRSAAPLGETDRAARREADLVAASWVIDHLRGRLDQNGSN